MIINPNSNEAVTEGLSRALAPLRFADGPAIDRVTLAQGPFGIESDADTAAVVAPLRELVVARAADCDAFVIACYSDPGLHVCREAVDKPVFGIQECGVLAALAAGERFGVIAIRAASVRRHLRYLRQMGLDARLAGERALDMSVAESAGGEATFARLVEVGTDLRDQDGADVIVLGCAGMARHRAPLEAALSLPVIDPTQAATAMAIAAVRLKD